MNKKFIFTSVCLVLGCFSLTDAALAKSDNANKKSMKKCPKTYLKDDAAVRLTKEFPNSRFSEGALVDDPSDDFYEICNANYSVCNTVVNAPVVAENGLGLVIIGTNRANTIEGTPGDDIICGLSGNDTIDGKEGDDEIHGNNGSDDLSGGLGDDNIYGGNGRDTLWGYDDDNDDLDDADLDDGIPETDDSDNDLLEGGNGKDTLSGGPGDDTLRGGNGKDDLDGGAGDDILDGGKGKDDCVGDDVFDGTPHESCENEI